MRSSCGSSPQTPFTHLDINAFSYRRTISVAKRALEVTNKTEKQIKGYPSATFSFHKFISWLNTHRDLGEYYTLVGYRTQFDLEMLLGYFQDQVRDTRKLYDYIHYKHLDLLQLVLFMDLYDSIKVPNHKLETMCNYYGISITAHDPKSDIDSTRKLHKKLMEDLDLPFSKIKKV